MKEETIEISKSELEEIAELLNLAESFLLQALCDNFTLQNILELRTKQRNKKIKKKEVLKYIDVCYPLSMNNPEKVKKTYKKCNENYEKIMKKIKPHFITREESANLLKGVFKTMINNGEILPVSNSNN